MALRNLSVLIVLALVLGFSPDSAAAQYVSMETPSVYLDGIGFDVSVEVKGDTLAVHAYQVQGTGAPVTVEQDPSDGKWSASNVVVSGGGEQVVTLLRDGVPILEQATREIPGWFSIIPPLIAIAVALIFKRVIPALFLGLWVGATMVVGLSFTGAFSGLLNAFQVYVLNAFIEDGHASVVLFSCMIGGMVGIISRNGGMQGVVNHIVKWANTAKRGQVATGILGIAIFFDDYANTLVVGNTMRPVTDKLRISREKLAYIVDSTAAPVACIAFVTTWIGYEVGLIGDAMTKIDGLTGSPFGFFLASIPYSFYPILAIFFVFAVSLTQRDFGPMLKAEIRTRSTGAVLGPDADVDDAALNAEEAKPIKGKPQRAINAVLPVLVLVFGVLIGLYATGEGDTIRDIIGSADSYKALMWASLGAVIVAAVLTSIQRIMGIGQIVEAWYTGLKSMLFAMIILELAWALSAITSDLHTAPYLVSILGDSLVPGLLPAVVFILAAATAFATGSSWGTMGILLPLVLPLTWAVMTVQGVNGPEDMHILYSAISCILAGSVWGDHCSPISDTTILSSMASGCDHIEHVRTQLPYAGLVGGVAVFLGTIPAGFGFPWWASLLIGMAILLGVLKVFGKNADDHLPDVIKG